jgi:alpha-galactosidase
MPKITFMGAGSSCFAKNVLGDSMLTESLQGSDIALYDIDAERLDESQRMLDVLNKNINEGRATIKSYCGPEEQKAALDGADFVVNAIQVGRYDPCTIRDFEIPKKYGLRQTIADTLGIGGIFRTLRTVPVMLDFARDMQAVCPDALLLNYTNPQATLVGAIQKATDIKIVGLCHSVQICATRLLSRLGIATDNLQWDVAGINHMAWLLSITDNGKDLYPEIKKRAAEWLDKILAAGGGKAFLESLGDEEDPEEDDAPKPKMVVNDMVRLRMMLELDYYITESSEHHAEYSPLWIKRGYEDLIDQYNIPLDEYPRRCVSQIEKWATLSKDLIENPDLTHEKSHEYGSVIMNSIVTDTPARIHGSTRNTGLITNLPSEAIVEVATLVDRNGLQPTFVGELPTQCAAMNQTNINTQLLTIEASLNHKRETIYQAAMLDPHTAAELSIDDIRSLCDDLIEAHSDYLPEIH